MITIADTAAWPRYSGIVTTRVIRTTCTCTHRQRQVYSSWGRQEHPVSAARTFHRSMKSAKWPELAPRRLGDSGLEFTNTNVKMPTKIANKKARTIATIISARCPP